MNNEETLTIYVDGGAGIEPKYAYFVEKTGQTRIVISKNKNITNNQAEYLAILRTLVDYQDSENPIIIKSDSKNTVNQINHQFAINNNELRKLALQIWSMIGQMTNQNIIFTWVPRKENLAGKILGS
jgi:ribonuclease HI